MISHKYVCVRKSKINVNFNLHFFRKSFISMI